MLTEGFIKIRFFLFDKMEAIDSLAKLDDSIRTAEVYCRQCASTEKSLNKSYQQSKLLAIGSTAQGIYDLNKLTNNYLMLYKSVRPFLSPFLTGLGQYRNPEKIKSLLTDLAGNGVENLRSNDNAYKELIEKIDPIKETDPIWTLLAIICESRGGAGSILGSVIERGFAYATDVMNSPSTYSILENLISSPNKESWITRLDELNEKVKKGTIDDSITAKMRESLGAFTEYCSSIREPRDSCEDYRKNYLTSVKDEVYKMFEERSAMERELGQGASWFLDVASGFLKNMSDEEFEGIKNIFMSETDG